VVSPEADRSIANGSAANRFPALIVEEVKGCPIENPSQFQGQQSPPG